MISCHRDHYHTTIPLISQTPSTTLIYLHTFINAFTIVERLYITIKEYLTQIRHYIQLIISAFTVHQVKYKIKEIRTRTTGKCAFLSK